MPRISPGHFLFINRRGGRAGPGGRAAAAAGPGGRDRRPARDGGGPRSWGVPTVSTEIVDTSTKIKGSTNQR